MENYDIEEGARELQSLQSLQIFLNGHEANALICAVLLMRTSPVAREDLAPILKSAEVAARKLQQLFLLTPVSYAAIEHGWKMSDRENFPAKEFPPGGFNR